MNKFQLLASASLMTFIIGPHAAAQAPEVAGSAIVAIPSIQAVLGEQAPRSIAIGNELFRDELITTGPDGHLHILFRDESNMTLGPNAVLRIDEFVYNPSTGVGSLVVEQTAGVMRFIGGAISKTGAVRINTVVGTIGVRGGVALIRILEGGGVQAFFVFGDELTVESVSGDTVSLGEAGFSVAIAANGEIGAPTEISPADLSDTLNALESPESTAAAVTVPDAVLSNLQDRLEPQVVDPDTGLLQAPDDVAPVTIRELETILGADVLEEESVQEVFETISDNLDLSGAT